MFNLSESNIHLSAQASNKEQAIQLVAQALEQADYVESGYLKGMLAREQQTSTFLGNGIAIPHGTLETRSMVKNTGVQVFQFPQGIVWEDGHIAYVVIGIAARSDEHLTLLRQLTHVLSDEEKAKKLATLQDAKQFRAILMGEEETFVINRENIHLDVDTSSLLALVAINAGQLQQQNAVDNQFVTEIIANAALPLGKGLWLADSAVGNLKNSLAFSRAKHPFENNGKTIHAVITIAMKNESLNDTLIRLLDEKVQHSLLTGNLEQILAALKGDPISIEQTPPSFSQTSQSSHSVIGTFTVRNENGLHARPSANLVNLVKPFDTNITVENISRGTPAVNAKSLMKLVALGVICGHRLRFVAEGKDAQQAIEAIAKEITLGFGEPVSAVPPTEPDSIEVIDNQTSQPVKFEETMAEEVEGVFVIQNDHGLHARPVAVLVNEVKKYQASIAVQNLDRDSQLVSAKSAMKILALGAVKGHRLRFVATGEDAQQAIDGIGVVIATGLGE